MFVAFCSLSYGQKSGKLVKRAIEGFVETEYSYNEDGKVDLLHVVEPDYEAYRKFAWNEDGTLHQEDGYQWYMGEWKYVFRVDYTYDDKGRMLTRMNYNSAGADELSLSGRMMWEYNDNGDIAFVRTYFPSWDYPGEFDLFAEERYSYDGKGLLGAIETYMVPFGSTDPNEMSLTGKTEYTYDENDRLTVSTSTEYDSYTGEDIGSSRAVYTYDADGNVSEHASYVGQSKTPQVKSVFHYDKNVNSADVLLPLNFDDNAMPHMFAMINSVNTITSEEWWQVSNETDELTYIDTYVYTYGSTAGIGDVPVAGPADVNFFISDGKLYFHNLKPGAKVRIYNAGGVEVMSAAYGSEGVSLSSLPKGVYITRVDGQKAAFKFMR